MRSAVEASDGWAREDELDLGQEENEETETVNGNDNVPVFELQHDTTLTHGGDHDSEVIESYNHSGTAIDGESALVGPSVSAGVDEGVLMPDNTPSLHVCSLSLSSVKSLWIVANSIICLTLSANSGLYPFITKS